MDAEDGLLHGLEVVVDAEDVEGGVGEVFDFFVVVLVDEVAGQDTHADEVGAVDALEGFRDDGFHTEEVGALGGPVAGGAHAVVFAADDHGRRSFFLIDGGGVVDGLGFAVDLGHSTFDSGNHEVLDADVGEGAAGHDAVVAAA